MKRIIFLLTMIIAAASCFAQGDVRGKRGIFNSTYMGTSPYSNWIDTVKNDTAHLDGNTNSLMTSNAVYDFVTGNTRQIKNQNTSKQTGNFWISNTGRFGKKREPTGIIHQDFFTGAGFGSLYDTSVTNVTRTFNGSYLKDSVKAAGEGSINNFITVAAPTGRSKWVQEVKWLATRKNLQDYGIGIGLRSTNSFFSPDFFVHFVWRNNLGQNGSAQLYLDNLTPGSPFFITHDTVGTTIGDTMISRVEYSDGLITIKYTNQTTGETVDTSYYYGTSVAGTYQAPNTAKFVLRFFGGVHQIFSWTIFSEERKGNVLFLGNSITYGYTASVFDSTFPAQIFPQRWMYEKSGGPGDRTADVITKLAEIVALDPEYIVYSMGVNDKQSSVSAATFGANTRRIMDTLTAHHIPVIILSLSPLNSSSVVPFNDTLHNIANSYGYKYVNDFDSLRNGGTSWNSSYTTDNVHPNTLGHTIRARILAREAPEILGDTAIAVDRLLYKEDLPYIVAYDEEDGIFKVTNRGAGGSGSGIGAVYPGYGMVQDNDSTLSIDHDLIDSLAGLVGGNFANTDLTFTGDRVHDANGYGLAVNNISGLYFNSTVETVIAGDNGSGGTGLLNWNYDEDDNGYQFFSRGNNGSDKKVGFRGFQTRHTMYAVFDGDSTYIDMDPAVPHLSFDAGTGGNYYFHSVPDGTIVKAYGQDATGTMVKADMPSGTSLTGSQGDIIYFSATNTVANLTKGSAHQYLSSDGTSNNPLWEAVNLADGVTGTLPVGNGGTGKSSVTSNSYLKGNGTGALVERTYAQVKTDLATGMDDVLAVDQRLTANRTMDAGGFDFRIDSTQAFTVESNTGRIIATQGDRIIYLGNFDFTGNGTAILLNDLGRAVDILADSFKTARANRVIPISDSANWFVNVRNKSTGIHADMYIGALTGAGGSYTDEAAQDAVGAMVSSEFTYTDGTPLLALATGGIANSKLTNSTISGIALGSNLANLTATDATVVFSGTYTGATARTIGLNLNNANTWTADQSVPDEAYDATAWDGSVEVPTKNAIRDKIESLSGSGDMVLASVQSVTGLKTFDKDKLAMKGTSTGVTTISTANTSGTNYTATLKAATGTIAYTSDITGTNSGTNTGDQTSIVGITGTKSQYNTSVTDGDFLFVGDITGYTDELAQDAIGAMINSSLTYTDGTPLLALTSRTIGGVAFDGTANITVATATGGFTVSGGNLALGTNSLTLTGSIASTGSRVTKGWFTDIESTNAPTVSGAAVYYTGGADVAVADGGTGASTLTGILQGNGTSAFTTITNSTTVGQVLRVTGSNTYGFGAVDLADADAITGTLPVANGGTGITSLGTGVATFLGTPSSSNLAAAVTGETGTGALVFGTSPDFTTGASIGGVTIPTISSTNDLSNKRWVPRIGSTTSSGTPTINTDNVDVYKLTALAANITSFTTNLSGTPNDGDVLVIEITGTATRTIAWGTSFVSSTVTLPTTTSGTTTLTTVLRYSSTSSYGTNKWVCVNSF